MRYFLVCSAIALLLPWRPLLSQQTAPAASPTQPPLITTTVDEVILDVVVRDKKGKPVTDLTAADFTVADAGVRQKLTGFRLVQGAEAISEGSRTPLDPLRQIRLVTLVFERLGVEARRVARQAAQDLIKGDQAQNVFYSVVAIDRQLFVLQPFTSDKDRLKKAIDQATSGKYSQYAEESDRIKNQLRQMATKHQPPTPPAPTPSSDPRQAAAQMQEMGSQAVQARLAQVMMSMLQFDASTSGAEDTRTSIFSLLSLVRGQFSMPGRKTILYFSEGMWIPTHLDEPFRSVISTANRTNVTFYAVDTRGVMTWGQNVGAVADLQRAAEASSSTMLQTEGPVTRDQVMASDTMEASMRSNVQLPLRNLSESTGGFLIGDSNDLRGPLRRVNEEVTTYYELAYNPGIESYDGGFRKTEVALAREGLTVHTRNGYFALPPDVRAAGLQPFEMPLLKALAANPLPRDLDFRSGAVRFQPGPQGIQSSVVVEVPLAGLQYTEDPAAKTFQARLSLVALIKLENGEVFRKFTRDLPLRGTSDRVSQIKQGNFI